ncbi:MAG: metallophosphoesterase [Candidatus Pacearchaeota archaeon]|nr:metallophosphoesterase [Candidatus Pacearchaeota archaeon]
MDNKEILKFCVERGLLLDPEVLKLFSETTDDESIKLIIEKIRSYTQKRIITKELFEENREQVSEFFLKLPKENQEKLERLKIKLGLQIEISKESALIADSPIKLYSIGEDAEEPQVKVLSKTPSFRKKIEIDDFVKNLRNRFQEMREILQEHSELEGLVSINKLSKTRQKISIIGIISDKRTTKNNNILLEAEDLTGKIKILINQNKPELYKKAEELCLDSVAGFTGFGDRDIFFANNIVIPEAMLAERKKSPFDENVLFIGDLHYGSKLFLEESFMKFVDYLNGKNEKSGEVEKIKYLFLLGDVVAGVGVYPNQKKDLKIEDLEAQFQGLAELLSKIRRGINIIISPGNHDGVRLMEPQPILDEKYAWPLYNMKNVTLTGNPSYVNIGARKKFSGFDILTYHGVSYPFYANTIPSLVEKSLNEPDKIMAYLLRNRHLAPTYSSVQICPSEKDELVIKKIPDIFVSGHIHTCKVSYYNNILVISGSGWEEETEYQKRKGNKPDFCKVPMFNLKTRAIKILDFDIKEEHERLIAEREK